MSKQVKCGAQKDKESRTEGIKPFGTALFFVCIEKNQRESKISPGSPRQHSRIIGQNRREDGERTGKNRGEQGRFRVS